jgi:hypothetical protein
VHVERQRREDVVAEEAPGVAGPAGVGAQVQLEPGEGAVGPGQVDRQDRGRDRGVHDHQPRPPEREQGAGQHEQHGGAVQDRDPVRQEHGVSLPRIAAAR